MLARYDRVTAADVQRVAAQYLTRPKVVLTVVPEGSASSWSREEPSERPCTHAPLAPSSPRASRRRPRAPARASSRRRPPPRPVAVAPTPHAGRPDEAADARRAADVDGAADHDAASCRTACKIVVVEQHELPARRRAFSRSATGGEAIRPERWGRRRSSPRCSRKARRRAPRCRSPIRRRISASSSSRRAAGSRARSRCTRRPRSSTARWRCSPTSRFIPAFPTADLERVRKVRLTALQQLRDRGAGDRRPRIRHCAVRRAASVWTPAGGHRSFASRRSRATKLATLLHDATIARTTRRCSSSAT